MGLVLALGPLFYWVLRGVASRPIPPAPTATDFSELLPTMLWQGFATGDSYLLLLTCVLGAVVSTLRRR